MKNFRVLCLSAALLAAGSGAVAQTRPAAPSVDWTARSVEHLYNRAGFGARPSEIEEGLALGRAALVEKLLSQRSDAEPFFVERIEEPRGRILREMTQEERQRVQREYREKDRRQLLEYTGWWIDRMAAGDDPLLERMTLFWHGLFTTSIEDVKRGWLCLEQNRFVREHALDSYAVLLRGIAKDPAMLVYLDNQVNRKGNPNENLARELLELFSLGQGNYTEPDIKEAARALTGRGIGREGEYSFNRNQHDGGEKTILGVKGKHDGDALVDILLAQDACPRYVARKLLAYFEGVEPSKARLEEYAASLKRGDYAVQPFLRKLFTDPAFYRDEIVGARVQGPVEYMVGAAHRLNVRVPAVIVGSGAALLGQRLFAPPSVKGWDEGEAWITTASLMQRGNLAGLMLGVVKVDDVLSQADMDVPMSADERPMEPGKAEPGMEGKASGPAAGRTSDGKPAAKGAPKGGAKGGGGFAYQALRRMETSGWAPAINFSARLSKSGARNDAEIVDAMLDSLLAIRAPDDTRTKLREFLARERADLEVRDGKLLDAGADAERVLRRLAHLILSLPEAQLG